MGKRAVVVTLGGGMYTYEDGSSFHATQHWLTVTNHSNVHCAVFAQHRVVRAYYTYGDKQDGLLEEKS